MKKILFLFFIMISNISFSMFDDENDFKLAVELNNYVSNVIVNFKEFKSRNSFLKEKDKISFPLKSEKKELLTIYINCPTDSFIEYDRKFISPLLYPTLTDEHSLNESFLPYLKIAPQNFIKFEIILGDNILEDIELGFFNIKLPVNYLDIKQEIKYSFSNYFSSLKNNKNYYTSIRQAVYYDLLVREDKEFSINYKIIIDLIPHDARSIECGNAPRISSFNQFSKPDGMEHSNFTTSNFSIKDENIVNETSLIIEKILPPKENIDLLIREKKEAKQKWQLSQKKLPENIKKANELTVDELEMEALYQKFVQDYRKIGKSEYDLPSEINFLHKQVEENRKNRFNKFINEHKQNQKNYESIKEKVKFLKNTKKD